MRRIKILLMCHLGEHIENQIKCARVRQKLIEIYFRHKINLRDMS